MNTKLADQDCPAQELIGGKIVAMSPTATSHNRIAENIHFMFRTYLKGKRCVPLGNGYDLYLTDQDRFIPDFMVVCDRDKIKEKGVYGAPDLVVEVLSTGTARNDKWHKKNVYAASGVPEYWIVSPGDRFVEVYRIRDGGYALDNLYTHCSREEWEDLSPGERAAVVTEFKCHLYDDFVIRVDEIFSDW